MKKKKSTPTKTPKYTQARQTPEQKSIHPDNIQVVPLNTGYIPTNNIPNSLKINDTDVMLSKKMLDENHL